MEFIHCLQKKESLAQSQIYNDQIYKNYDLFNNKINPALI